MDKIASALKNGSRSSSLTASASSLSIELAGHEKNVNQLSWYSLGAQDILASASSDKTVKLWPLSTAAEETPSVCLLSILTGSENLAITWHPLMLLLVIGTKDDRVLFYKINDTLSQAELVKTLEFSVEVNELSWSADGLDLSISFGNGQVEIYRFSPDHKSLDKFRSIKLHTADSYCVQFKGVDLMAIGSSDSQVSLWSRRHDYTCFRVLNRMEWPIRSLSFSHDEQFLAVASEDPFIAIEHIYSGALVAKIPTGKSVSSGSKSNIGVPINSVSWHPSKHILAFAGSEVDDRTGKPTGAIKLFGLC
jgi:THO complex subunit 3